MILRRIIAAFLITFSTSVFPQSSPETQRCITFIETSPSQAHENSDCLAAAEQGNAAIQFALGRSHSLTTKTQELYWFGRAADSGYVEAYLEMGNLFRNIPTAGPDPAIHWYTRYWEADGERKGFAAAALAELELQRGNVVEADLWRSRCEETEYESCEN